jgi:hypothetical protein
MLKSATGGSADATAVKMNEHANAMPAMTQRKVKPP